MGQKTDTKNIFQIEKNNNKYIWDAKYFEKNKDESNIFIYQNLEIKKFIKKILKDNGLILYKYNIHFFETSLKIFIFYLKLPKSQNIINLINNNQKLRLIKKKLNTKNYNIIQIKKTIRKYLETKKQSKTFFFLDHFIFNKKDYISSKKIVLKKNFNFYKNNIFLEEIKKKFENYYKKKTKKQGLLKKILNKLLIKKIKVKKRLKILQYYKYYIKIKRNVIIKNIKINNFLEKIIESLNIFTSNKFNIILNIQQLSNNLNYSLTYYQLQYIKKTIIKLRQFKKSKFFKEGVNIIFLSIIKKESTQLLVNFIADQLKLIKKHNFFFRFLKKTLSLILLSKISKIISIKIIIKGKFNGKQRSNKKIITINKNMSLMTFNSNVKSAQSMSHGPNGTFGVKLWVNEK